MDNSRAELMLKLALARANKPKYRPKYPRFKPLEKIILGDHLTFRYLLVTAVLGKATDPQIHPRAIQAGALLDGAFDARSLCHRILVPFERQFLDNALGGSNEPYLNKPARYTTIDPKNPVRAGKDRSLLEVLCEILDDLNARPDNQVFDALSDCVYLALQRLKFRKDLLSPPIDQVSGINQILQFVRLFSSKSLEGETCAVLTGALLSCMGKLIGENFRVIVHPVNQAGSSSNEVSDVDAYIGEVLKYTIEVKDKEFSLEDLQHAVQKVANARHGALTFIMGPRGSLRDGIIEEVETRLASNNLSVVCISLEYFAKTTLSLVPETTMPNFYRSIVKHCTAARVKDQTIRHLNFCSHKLGWISVLESPL